MDAQTPLLTHKNFLIYSMQNYDNIHCSGVEEFQEDIQRIKHLKKLITRYQKTGELRARLILNHCMVLYNTFGPIATTRMLYLKMGKEYMPFIVPCLIQIGIWPTHLWNVGEIGSINTDSLPLNQKMVDALRKL
jgi:hypothetical protein